MKTLVKLTLTIFLFSSFQSAEAQLLKRLKNKLNTKVEQKIESEMNKTLDSLSKPKQKKERNSSEKSEKKTSTSGVAFLKHTQKYGSLSLEELGKASAKITDEEVRIFGSWVTMSADIQDGYVLVIPNGAQVLFDGTVPKKEQIMLRIPQDAQLELSYDPTYDPNYEDENGFSSAVTKDYQSYKLESGQVTIDVFSKDNFQVSFSGDANLVTRKENPDKNSEDKYLLSYAPSSVSGMVDVGPVNFVDLRTVSKDDQISSQAPEFNNQNTSSGPTGMYKFSFETKVVITGLDGSSKYNMSYLLNPNEKYIAIKADMSEYSDEEMAGESIIVMDGENTHIFVETQGMKMRMSQNMMGGQQMSNPTEQMANYDYSKITKTGKTRTILGATCYEYMMSDANVKMNLWVAPEVNLPNWFVQNTDVIDGHIMAYTITSKDGSMTSETIAINDNIKKIINPKDYKKMF